jgi:hypothetical protein
VQLRFRVDVSDASLTEILDRVLDGGIVFEPSVRFFLYLINFEDSETRVVVAPDRRRDPLVLPETLA